MSSDEEVLTAADALKLRLEAGQPLDSLVAELRQEGFSITRTITIVRLALDVSLPEAERLVASNPA